ncbi:RusA family crossover junction endodeoxyribonuclease [Dictyobacter kobayashii]|uniref:Uncharacterized protein n=1 Tax=Dictyobacter kobayashii TaxID=2014872 RepID=A0A402AER2_9CHLR|nr:RusA family crossover junction endodeoxyribonuclease [Dictyobacter kobayashii]GCE17573.1 hypothetical protein KDK_13730 [Dictyobacter kobayashii]
MLAKEMSSSWDEVVAVSSAPFFRGRLPLPPGVNQSYQVVRAAGRKGARGRIGPSAALEMFKAEAALVLADGDATHQDWSLINAIRGSKRHVSLVVHVAFFFPTLWKRDVDGGIKAVVDAAFARMELNDNLVVRLTAEKFVDADDPRCEVTVSCVVGR